VFSVVFTPVHFTLVTYQHQKMFCEKYVKIVSKYKSMNLAISSKTTDHLVKSNRIMLEGHVASMEEVKNSY
jgi:hypothetical protein